MDLDKPDNLESSRSEWEDNITPEQALQEVNAAKARVFMKKRMEDFSKTLDLKRQEDRWRAMYDFLYKYNPSVSIALDDFNRDCERLKQEQSNFKARSKNMQYGLHFPKMLWDALSLVDPEIMNFDSLDEQSKKKIYRKLGRAFPIYWMPRV